MHCVNIASVKLSTRRGQAKDLRAMYIYTRVYLRIH